MEKDAKSTEARDLSAAERILEAQDAWDELSRDPDSVEITEAQIREAERRWLEYQRTRPRCSTWEEVKRRLESRP